jgi:hypothetical protein
VDLMADSVRTSSIAYHEQLSFVSCLPLSATTFERKSGLPRRHARYIDRTKGGDTSWPIFGLCIRMITAVSMYFEDAIRGSYADEPVDWSDGNSQRRGKMGIESSSVGST